MFDSQRIDVLVFVVYLFSFQRSDALTDALRRSPSVECLLSIGVGFRDVTQNFHFFQSYFFVLTIAHF